MCWKLNNPSPEHNKNVNVIQFHFFIHTLKLQQPQKILRGNTVDHYYALIHQKSGIVISWGE